jgi:hypothetical protein
MDKQPKDIIKENWKKKVEIRKNYENVINEMIRKNLEKLKKIKDEITGKFMDLDKEFFQFQLSKEGEKYEKELKELVDTSEKELKDFRDSSEKELKESIKEFSESIKLDLNDEYLNFLKDKGKRRSKRKSKRKKRSKRKSKKL